MIEKGPIGPAHVAKIWTWRFGLPLPADAISDCRPFPLQTAAVSGVSTRTWMLLFKLLPYEYDTDVLAVLALPYCHGDLSRVFSCLYVTRKMPTSRRQKPKSRSMPYFYFSRGVAHPRGVWPNQKPRNLVPSREDIFFLRGHCQVEHVSPNQRTRPGSGGLIAIRSTIRQVVAPILNSHTVVGIICQEKFEELQVVTIGEACQGV